MNNKIEKQELSPEPLKGQLLDNALESLRSEKGLDPVSTNKFLSIETAGAPGLSKLDKVIPAALMAAYVGTFAATRLMGAEFLPTEVPPLLHQLLQGVHNVTVNAARNPTLGEHLPFLLLEAAGVWGAIKTLPNWLKARSKIQRIRETQQTVRKQISEGEFKYDMAKGHTAAFIGLGDPLADRLQQIKNPDQVMLYSHAKIDNQVWQLIKNGQLEQIYQALERGDFKNAGEVLLLPVKYEDMFLPDKTGHDMTIDEIAAIIHMIDDYSESRGLLKKRVVIVGNKDMEEIYIKRTSSRKTEKSKKTLAELVFEMSQERNGSSVEIIDPTEIVMRKITALAQGKTIEFVTTKEGDQRYGQRFFEQLSGMSYRPSTTEVTRVLYNITDIPTEVRAKKDDIAVIFDPSKKQGLLARGLAEENIIVVPDVILHVLSGEVDKS